MYNYSVHSTGTSTRMKKVWTTFNYLITFVKYKIRKIGKEQKKICGTLQSFLIRLIQREGLHSQTENFVQILRDFCKSYYCLFFCQCAISVKSLSYVEFSVNREAFTSWATHPKGVASGWSTNRFHICPRYGFRQVHESVSNRSTYRFPIGSRKSFRQVHETVSNRSTYWFPIGPRNSFRQIHKTVSDRSTANRFPIGPRTDFRPGRSTSRFFQKLQLHFGLGVQTNSHVGNFQN